MNIVTLFNGAYRIEGVLKLLTGIVSCVTAVMTVRLFPMALQLRSPAEIVALNKVLQERTSELEKANKASSQAKDEADHANKAKSEFLSRISHELRTPLNAILGFGQLLERQNSPDIQRNRVGHITSAGRHLLKLIDEVLDISRIEAGTLQLFPEPVCVADALQETLDLMRPLATERVIELSTASALDSGSFVLADRHRFTQVLLNLVTNAIKYTPEGGSVTVSCGASGNGVLRIAVCDTGPGIPVEKLTRLFTPFDRLGAEQSTVQGTGLGLALCHRLIEAMNGSIGVNSTIGEGSIFWVELPCAPPPLNRVSSLPKCDRVSPRQIASPEKHTLLYIEDNLSNLTLVEEILAEQPEIDLIAAMQGQLGLDLARKHLPDLILLDLLLPDLTGEEVIRQLRRDDRTRHIPVVVISADATADQINTLMVAGAHAYLTKPLDVSEFLQVVDEALSKNGTKAATT